MFTLTRPRIYEPAWQAKGALVGNSGAAKVKAIQEMVEYARILNNSTLAGDDAALFARNKAKALEIYAWAAQQGNGEAAWLLGFDHHTAKNYPEAVIWYQKAKELGLKERFLDHMLNLAKEGKGGGGFLDGINQLDTPR